MNKSILYLAMSLDGFVAGKDDDISWLFPYNDVDYGYKEFFATIGSAIEGKRTYDVGLKQGWGNFHPVPTFILTHNPPAEEPAYPDTVFTNDDIETVLMKAKAKTDKNVWITGGAQVAQEFLRKGLVDEFILTTVPVILGEGIRLLDNIDMRILLSLQEVKTFDKGLVQCTYLPEM
ncbi:MAG: bifunctional deaminase-reductase domain protein [Candidatus Peribacteria bacterium]|nr:bifunctional deaminase-reductase domain protein [Candidatus Peribacteria bacterium]